MNKKVVILGAGGHAHVIADMVTAQFDEVIAFLDDDESAPDRKGCLKDYKSFADAEFIIGIGDSAAREKIADEFDVKWYTAIHPGAIISPSATIGEGTAVMPNAVINARTVIGKHCIINSGAIVEHDNQLSDYVHISVGAKTGGNVSIGRKTWVGIGATVKNGIEICPECVIGAGATVVKDIQTGGIYIGIPAKPVK